MAHQSDPAGLALTQTGKPPARCGSGQRQFIRQSQEIIPGSPRSLTIKRRQCSLHASYLSASNPTPSQQKRQ